MVNYRAVSTVGFFFTTCGLCTAITFGLFVAMSVIKLSPEMTTNMKYAAGECKVLNSSATGSDVIIIWEVTSASPSLVRTVQTKMKSIALAQSEVAAHPRGAIINPCWYVIPVDADNQYTVAQLPAVITSHSYSASTVVSVVIPLVLFFALLFVATWAHNGRSCIYSLRVALLTQKDFEKIRGKKNQEADDIRGFREKYQSNRVSMQIHDLEKEAKLRKQQNEEDLVLGKKHTGGGDPSRLNLWRLSDDLGDPQALFATRTIRQWTIWVGIVIPFVCILPFVASQEVPLDSKPVTIWCFTTFLCVGFAPVMWNLSNHVFPDHIRAAGILCFWIIPIGLLFPISTAWPGVFGSAVIAIYVIVAILGLASLVIFIGYSWIFRGEDSNAELFRKQPKISAAGAKFLMSMGVDSLESISRYQMETLMKKYDTDGSGQIDEQEFKFFLKDLYANSGRAAPKEELLHELFRQADSDNSGSIDTNEFMSMFKSGKSEGEKFLKKLGVNSLSSLTRDQMRLIMMKYDTNGDGRFDRDEFKKALCDLYHLSGKPNPSRSELDNLYQQADSDGSGFVERDEFMAMFDEQVDEFAVDVDLDDYSEGDPENKADSSKTDSSWGIGTPDTAPLAKSPSAKSSNYRAASVAPSPLSSSSSSLPVPAVLKVPSTLAVPSTLKVPPSSASLKAPSPSVSRGQSPREAANEAEDAFAAKLRETEMRMARASKASPMSQHRTIHPSQPSPVTSSLGADEFRRKPKHVDSDDSFRSKPKKQPSPPAQVIASHVVDSVGASSSVSPPNGMSDEDFLASLDAENELNSDANEAESAIPGETSSSSSTPALDPFEERLRQAEIRMIRAQSKANV